MQGSDKAGINKWPARLIWSYKLKTARQIMVCAFPVGAALLLVCWRLCFAVIAIRLAYLSRNWAISAAQLAYAIPLTWLGVRAWRRSDTKLAILLPAGEFGGKWPAVAPLIKDLSEFQTFCSNCSPTPAKDT